MCKHYAVMQCNSATLQWKSFAVLTLRRNSIPTTFKLTIFTNMRLNFVLFHFISISVFCQPNLYWRAAKNKNNLTTQHDATYRITIELYSKFSRLLFACWLVVSHFNVTIRCLWYTQQKVEHAHRISLALVWSGRKIQLPYKLQSQFTVHNKVKLRCKQTVYTSSETQTHTKTTTKERERENPHISISTSLCTLKMCPNENE